MEIHSLSVSKLTAFPPQRLDRWLSQQLPQISRSRLQKLIEQGQVQVDGQICLEKRHLLQAGQQVQVQIPPVETLDLIPEPIPLEILYEDSDLLVLNKPKDRVVHPSAGHGSGTLVNALLAHCQDLSGINGEYRPGIVHRLDKNTTGALVVAKTDQAHHHLQAQIQAKTARRIYLGVVYGRPQTSQGRIEAPIGRHPVDRQKMAVVPEPLGRRAVTHWQIRELLGNYTVMQFELETGRTHQIRVHSAHIHHPILGDPLYSSHRKTPVKLTGQALHAWQLSFVHPRSGVTIQCIAPLPDELQRLLDRLRQITS